MNDNSTRKQFFSKLLGVAAVAGTLPKIMAKSSPSTRKGSGSSAVRPSAAAIEIRHDARAVARREVV